MLKSVPNNSFIVSFFCPSYNFMTPSKISKASSTLKMCDWSSMSRASFCHSFILIRHCITLTRLSSPIIFSRMISMSNSASTVSPNTITSLKTYTVDIFSLTTLFYTYSSASLGESELRLLGQSLSSLSTWHSLVRLDLLTLSLRITQHWSLAIIWYPHYYKTVSKMPSVNIIMNYNNVRL